jgi:hypothetical protein
MKRVMMLLVLAAMLSGCGGGDDDDVAEQKTILPMDKVPAVVMEAAKKAAPDLTFFGAYSGTYQGKPAIELKGKTKNGKIKELEMSPEGVLLGVE